MQGCGENLSGGQRQRISLARAVYRSSPVYVLDDPLSAVDPRLRHSIFKDVLGRSGILRSRTRIVIIHELSLAECMDRIVLMQDRTVKDVGTLEQLQV